MTTNLCTLSFTERKQIIRLLVEEVVVDTTTEEITVRHILPVDQMFPLCKRRGNATLRPRWSQNYRLPFGVEGGSEPSLFSLQHCTIVDTASTKASNAPGL
jgi:hypothetical protein